MSGAPVPAAMWLDYLETVQQEIDDMSVTIKQIESDIQTLVSSHTAISGALSAAHATLAAVQSEISKLRAGAASAIDLGTIVSAEHTEALHAAAAMAEANAKAAAAFESVTSAIQAPAAEPAATSAETSAETSAAPTAPDV